MTGYDIFNKAAVLTGIEKNRNDYKEVLPEIALCAVNQIGSDLFDNFHINNIFDNIDLPPHTVSAFVCGVAMTVCAALEKYDASRHFTRLYNAKRAAVKSTGSVVKNAVPFV